jgi:hypothetical protein
MQRLTNSLIYAIVLYTYGMAKPLHIMLAKVLDKLVRVSEQSNTPNKKAQGLDHSITLRSRVACSIDIPIISTQVYDHHMKNMSYNGIKKMT